MWLVCGGMYVECLCMLAFMEFFGHNIIVIESVGGMCLNMGCLKKKVETKIVMGRLGEFLDAWLGYLVVSKKSHVDGGHLEIGY